MNAVHTYSIITLYIQCNMVVYQSCNCKRVVFRGVSCVCSCNVVATHLQDDCMNAEFRGVNSVLEVAGELYDQL